MYSYSPELISEHSVRSLFRLRNIAPVFLILSLPIGAVILGDETGTQLFVSAACIFCASIILIQNLKNREILTRRDPLCISIFIFSALTSISLLRAINLYDAMNYMTLVTSSFFIYWYITTCVQFRSFTRGILLPGAVLSMTICSYILKSHMLSCLVIVISINLLVSKPSIETLFYLLLCGINFYLISQSRLALFAIFLSLVITGMLQRSKLRLALSGISAVALVLVFILLQKPIDLKQFTNLPKIRHMITDHTVIGVGSTNFQKIFMRYNAMNETTYPVESDSNNLYLFFASEGGLLLLFSFILIVWIAIRRSLYFLVENKDETSAAMFSAIIIYFGLSFFMSPMQRPHEFAFLFIVLGIAEQTGNSKARFRKRTFTDLSSTVTVCIFIFFIFMNFFVAQIFISNLYFNSAMLTENRDDKIKTLKTSLELNPLNPIARLELAATLKDNNQERDAIYQYNYITKHLLPYHVPSLIECYKLYKKNNEHEEADKKLREIKGIMPNIKI